MPEREPIKLTPEDQKTLEDLQDDIDFFSRELARAEATGLEVAEMKKQFEDATVLRANVLREYGE